MKPQTIERIKVASNNFDVEFKKKRRAAAIKTSMSILFSGLALLCWTFTMLLVLIIVADPETGTKAFLEVNALLYQLYTIVSIIAVFIFLIEYVFKNKKNRVDKIIIKDPSNNKYK